MLNAVWLSFFVLAIGSAVLQGLLGNWQPLHALLPALFASAKSAVEICLGLVGVMSLWLGLLRVGEEAQVLAQITRWLQPLLIRLLPDVPAQHPAQGAVTLNLAANMLGLDNAATPLGLQAMRALQSLNPFPTQATNSQILFVVLNASSVTLLPLTVFAYRAQAGAANPTDVFVPILLATTVSTLVGFFSCALLQGLRWWHPTVLAYGVGLCTVVGGIAVYFSQLPAPVMQAQSALWSQFLLLGVVLWFLLAAAWQRINAFEAFIHGAKTGFETAVGIIPYLVALLAGIALLRASGVMEAGLALLRSMLDGDTRWVDALPVALMKPLSGSGARALMLDIMQVHGADSLAGRIACIIQGSTETTFYVLAVYFGAVGVSKTRYALACALLAEIAGAAAAIGIGYWFFAA